MPWSDSPNYEQPSRLSHAIGADIIVAAIMFGWAWVFADSHQSIAHVGRPVARHH